MIGIHPEYVLEKKGNDADKLINYMNLVAMTLKSDTNKDFQAMTMKAIKNKADHARLLAEVDSYKAGSGKLFTYGADNEKPGSTDMMSMKIKFFHNYVEAAAKRPVFAVGKEFFKAVSSLRREIPLRAVGTPGEYIYIKTPAVYCKDVKYIGVYITTWEIGAIQIMLIPEGPYTIARTKMVLITSPVVKAINLEDDFWKNLRQAPTTSEETIILSDCDWNNDEQAGFFLDWLVSVVNTTIYVYSQDPEIDKLRPLKLYTNKELGAMGKDVKDNLCTLPVTLVNWNYHTGRHYNVDEAFVGAHMRWQPCGPGRQELKLVFVKEHVRKYNNKEIDHGTDKRTAKVHQASKEEGRPVRD